MLSFGTKQNHLSASIYLLQQLSLVGFHDCLHDHSCISICAFGILVIQFINTTAGDDAGSQTEVWERRECEYISVNATKHN